MYQIYKIVITGEGRNTHSLGVREKTWELKYSESFNCLEDAKNYVVEKNRANSILVNYLTPNLTDQRKVEIIEEFCFTNDKYLHERRYFMGVCGADKKKEIKAIGQKICDALNQHQIKVINL